LIDEAVKTNRREAVPPGCLREYTLGKEQNMARSIKEGRRLLSPGELSLVEKTRRPALGQLPDHDLRELRKRLRECVGEVKDIAARQRHEWRGKAAHHGAPPKPRDSGTREKLGHLAAALKRLNKETAWQTAKAARQEASTNATHSPAPNQRQAASPPSLHHRPLRIRA
jgi:hypothetical protein